MGRCVAFNCNERGNYKFPKNARMRRKWENALRRVNFKSTEHSRLCRNHFTENDFEGVKKDGFTYQRRFLKACAIPSVFCWNQPSTSYTDSRTERLHRRNMKKCLMPIMDAPPVQESEELLPENNNQDLSYSLEVEVLTTEPVSIENSSTFERDIVKSAQSTQTPILFRLFSIDKFFIDDESVHYYTGLESYMKFKLVLSTLHPEVKNLKFHGSQVINIGIEDQFLIMLMKCRRNKDDFELSKYFGVSKTVIGNIFITWINFTYGMWSMIDIWPERSLVDYYMPDQFKINNPSTRIIIDTTEIPIATPTNPLSQQVTFSSYKNKNTVKFLVGATPGGLMCYCSEGYGGSTSDRQMIERSDLLNKCDQGDTIMADRGFNVQDIFATKDIAVNIPNFLKGQSQLSSLKVKHDRKLASQRVHIERLIGLSKTFKILKSNLNPYYTPLASRIFYVCVMLCNFREGIMKKNK